MPRIIHLHFLPEHRILIRDGKPIPSTYALLLAPDQYHIEEVDQVPEGVFDPDEDVWTEEYFQELEQFFAQNP